MGLPRNRAPGEKYGAKVVGHDSRRSIPIKLRLPATNFWTSADADECSGRAAEVSGGCVVIEESGARRRQC